MTDSKMAVAVDLLERIGQDRARVANSERSVIPAALRYGMSVEQVAQLAGTTVERVERVREEVDDGEG